MNKSVVAWEADWIIGDINDDGILDKRDIAIWKALYDLVGKHRNDIKEDEDGRHYYTYKDQEDNTVREYITEETLNLYEYIAEHYTDPFMNTAAEDVGYKFMPYIIEKLNNDESYYAAFGHEPGSTPADFSGDKEVNIADVNIFNNFMLKLNLNQNGYYVFDESDRRRHVRLCLSNTDESIVQLLVGADGKIGKIEDHMFIVRVEAKCGADIANLECGMDQNIITGLAFNSYPLYRNFIDMAQNNGDNCNSNINQLADYALRYFAFEFAIRNGDWCQAAYYWKNYLKDSTTTNTGFKRCGCHGIY